MAFVAQVRKPLDSVPWSVTWRTVVGPLLSEVCLGIRQDETCTVLQSVVFWAWKAVEGLAVTASKPL